ncbi:MAG: biotin--[acetyl-CoA-carboxylase] ligase [Spirochaetes bacterium]|nr:biotin--[acetyl-CoA-carboxylase] ligase [Spirochaetota bacterium]
MKNSIDIIDPEALRAGLKTSFIGQKIFYYERTASTNTIAVQLSKKGEAEGTVVIAEEQTGGKGRLGRQWYSTANKNILVSVIFRPQIEPSRLFFITMLSSVACVNAVKKICGVNAWIKWPNDIYIGTKKTAGILTEIEAFEGAINFVVVGIGLNVNFNPSDFPDIDEIATSILKEGGREFSRTELLAAVFEEMDELYGDLKNGRHEKIYDDWKKHSRIIGKQVRIISHGRSQEGVVESVGTDGTLVLIGKDGTKRDIICGDVSLRFTGTV